jgi:hypothetical protein
MLTALISLVTAISALVLILLALVVVGIRREPPTTELSSRPPSPIAGLTRRLLGAYVRRPDLAGAADKPDTCPAGHAANDEGR